MKSMQREILKNILSNQTSGSSEILSMLNTYFLSNISNRKLIQDSVLMVQSKLSHFAAINNYLNKLSGILKLKNADLLEEYLINFKIEENLQFKIIFDTSQVTALDDDMDKKYQRGNIGVAGGFMEVAEARELVGLEVRDG
ncbi:MAG: hypothetical protein IIA49_13625, partial [Bacteroidetes bacterium]|nr:hypothetical protein [Bacteroidota bacterium]